MMKDTAFFVNTARGKIVNEPALIDALRERRITGGSPGRSGERASTPC